MFRHRSNSSTKTPLTPKPQRNIPVPVASPKKTEQGDENSLEIVFKQFSNALASLDFDTFFKVFDSHSPVYRFAEMFDPAEFRDILLKAFPMPREGDGDKPYALSSAAKATLKAKKELDSELAALDSMFKRMEDVGLNVGNIRSTLAWVRTRNQETYAKLQKWRIPHPLDLNPLPKPPKQVQLPSLQYLEPPVVSPSPTSTNFPGNTHAPPTPTLPWLSHTHGELVSQSHLTYSPESGRKATSRQSSHHVSRPTYSTHRSVSPHRPHEMAELAYAYQTGVMPVSPAKNNGHYASAPQARNGQPFLVHTEYGSNPLVPSYFNPHEYHDRMNFSLREMDEGVPFIPPPPSPPSRSPKNSRRVKTRLSG